MADSGFNEIPEEEVKKLIKQDDESLADTLAQYREAFEQEFDTSDSGAAERVRTALANLVDEATHTVEYLLSNAKSESVRLHAAKFVYEVVLGKNLKEGQADPLVQLLKELRNNDNDGPSE